MEKHRGYFDNLINAAFNYVFPSLMEKIEARLNGGGSINIGPCKVTRFGVHYEVKGWIFTDQHFVPWRRVRVSIDNGDLYVVDFNDSKKRVSFSLRETDNAPLLRILANIKNGTDD